MLFGPGSIQRWLVSSKVFWAATVRASLAARCWATGSMPWPMRRFASSRALRASPRGTSGYLPSARTRSLPWSRNLRRQRRDPLSRAFRKRPPPSKIRLPVRVEYLRVRHCVSVRGKIRLAMEKGSLGGTFRPHPHRYPHQNRLVICLLTSLGHKKPRNYAGLEDFGSFMDLRDPSVWWLWVDSNHRPQHYECCALTG